MPDTLTAVCAALTEDQRGAIIKRFTGMNPHWNGAGVADIIDALVDNDSDLELTEPFFEANPDLAKTDGADSAVRALIWSGTPLTAGNVRWLLADRTEFWPCPFCGLVQSSAFSRLGHVDLEHKPRGILRVLWALDVAMKRAGPDDLAAIREALGVGT